MSNVPPPPGFPAPPPSGGFGPPPPPSRPGGFPTPPPAYRPAVSPGVPGGVPSGYVAYGQPASAVRPSAGLGKATIVLFWLVTLMSGLLALAFVQRRGSWDDFLAGNATLDDLQKADNLVGLSAVLQIAAQLTAVILVCLWARRIALNAKARGAIDVSPGLACGGWWIPIGWFWVGFTQLRKSMTAAHATSKNLGRWQAAFVVVGLVGVATRGFTGNIDLGDSQQEVSDTLSRQGVVGVVSFVLFVLASFLAMRAIKEIDRAVSGG